MPRRSMDRRRTGEHDVRLRTSGGKGSCGGIFGSETFGLDRALFSSIQLQSSGVRRECGSGASTSHRHALWFSNARERAIDPTNGRPPVAIGSTNVNGKSSAGLRETTWLGNRIHTSPGTIGQRELFLVPLDFGRWGGLWKQRRRPGSQRPRQGRR